MPATFESNGLKFLYPENWELVQRDQEEGGEGATLELPNGGFFSIERVHDPRPDDALLEDLVRSIQQDYQGAEYERITAEQGAETDGIGDSSAEQEFAGEIRFYYLDLLIISRLTLLTLGEKRYLIQAQAESRDFDQNLPVFTALLKQIRESTAS